MNRKVLVTGAASGLGYQLAKKYLENQDTVFGLDIRASKEARDLEREYSSFSFFYADLSSSRSVAEAAEEIMKKTDHLDLIFNNAGIYRFEDRVMLEETDMDGFSGMYEVNAVGPLRIVKNFGKLIGEKSVLIFTSSEAGSISDCWRSGEYAYCMSKAALNMGIRILANALRDSGVRLLAVHPGWMRTTMGGEGAAVDPSVSAEGFMRLVEQVDEIPQEKIYMEYDGSPLPW